MEIDKNHTFKPIKFYFITEHNSEPNRLDFGALLKSIIGTFKSIIGSSLVVKLKGVKLWL